MPGFRVFADDTNYDIQFQIRYKDDAEAEEVLTALSQAYARAFSEVDSRLGKVKIE